MVSTCHRAGRYTESKTAFKVNIGDIERLPELPSCLRNHIEDQHAIHSRPTRGEVALLRAAFLKETKRDAVQENVSKSLSRMMLLWLPHSAFDPLPL